MKIKELSGRERPREKLSEMGPAALSSGELLAILLRTGSGEDNAVELGQRLLNAADGKLTRLSAMSIDTMMSVKGIGKAKAVTIAAAFEIGRRFMSEAATSDKIHISNAGMVCDIMYPYMKALDHEELWCIFLNRANHIIGKEKLTSGGMSATTFDVPMIIRRVIEKKASSIIILHNHPSGDPRPGEMDRKSTGELKKALAPFGIYLTDHIVTGDGCYFSFAEEDVLPYTPKAAF